MGYGKQSNGLQTLLEHWGCLIPALVTVAFGSLLTFFFNLAGKPWIYFFVARPAHTRRRFLQDLILPSQRVLFYAPGHFAMVWESVASKDTAPGMGHTECLPQCCSVFSPHRIRTAQIKATLAANAELVLNYWEIGREIFASQKKTQSL